MKKTDCNVRDSFKLYKEKENPVLDIKDYISLCNNYHKFLINKVIEGNEVTMPLRLGTLQILGTKQKIVFKDNGEPNLPPDWKKTKELWDKCPECKEKKQRVFHTNDHTGGVRYRLTWSKRRVLIKNKTLYSFRLTRTNKREIYKEVLDGKEYFIKLN
jgi:hypothetical protein